MDQPGNSLAVIPCLNEGRTIAALVRSVRCHVAEVVVVDDGSRDHTAALAADSGASVLRHPRNFGKGAALKTGLNSANQSGFAWALIMDGDGQHRPEDIPAFMAKAQATQPAMVIGNRMHDAMSIPWLRRQVNRWMSRRISRRAGTDLPDTQCGFRLVHLNTWATLPCRTRRFEIESEMLLSFLSAGHRVDFVPIKAIGRSARSHINPIIDTWRWCRWWYRLRAGNEALNSPGSRPEHVQRCPHVSWLLPSKNSSLPAGGPAVCRRGVSNWPGGC